jgi:phenol hydroxylase P3 protein
MSTQNTAEYNRTKRLYWEPSYVPKEAIYPPANYEGIYFKDWDRWDDPFQMSFKQYVEIQAKKDNGFHPARDAFDRYGGTDKMDPRWVEGMKVVYPILFHGEYGALRSNARVSRYAPAPALRAAAFYQSIDELRHSQNHVYQMRMFNKHTEGFHNWAEWKRHHFLLQPAKMLFEDIVACENVFESVMGLNILVEVAYTNLVFVGIPSVGVLNGDTAGAAEFLTTQSDETRHMAIGQSTLRTLLEGDDRNLPQIQYWLDKWFWLLHRIIGCPLGVIPDYFAKRKALPMKQMFQRYIVDNYVAGMVEDLGDLGLQPPRFLDDAVREMEDAGHSLFRTLFQYKHMLFNKMFVPTDTDMEFFAEHYPHWEERHGTFWDEVRAGDPKDLPSLPMMCQVCQLPCIFPVPESPTIRCAEWGGEVRWFCSDGCQWIFDHEPERYSRAVGLDRVLTGKDVGEIREHMRLFGKLGGVLEEC